MNRLFLLSVVAPTFAFGCPQCIEKVIHVIDHIEQQLEEHPHHHRQHRKGMIEGLYEALDILDKCPCEPGCP